MRNTNGQLFCIEDNLVQTPYGLLITEIKKGESLSQNQIRFLENISLEVDNAKHFNFVTSLEKKLIENIKFYGVNEFVNALKMTHDLALYYTNLSLDSDEKKALFNLKILWEGLESLDHS